MAPGTNGRTNSQFVRLHSQQKTSKRQVWGHVAEWLRNGLQNRVPRFNSGRGLHFGAAGPISLHQGARSVRGAVKGLGDPPPTW